MSKGVDWSGSWPPMVFSSGFARWAARRLVLGLEVAMAVAAVMVGIAAKKAGLQMVWLAVLVGLACAVLSRFEMARSHHSTERTRF